MERFGRYVLLEKLASGGMGEVFRAAAVGSAGFAKPLAIKRILPHLAAEPSFVNMLIDEAKISAGLTHPNIVQVLDLGRNNGMYFIAMEFIAGQALNRVIGAALRRQRTLPHAFCAYAIQQALLGLAFAHEKRDSLGRPMGIIHRDISPQNIMVSYDGSVRLADFGIAKAAQRTTQTTGGALKGKPGYMSPEQVNGGESDQRLDLYAMGVVLHELLSMRRLRKGETDMQVLMEVSAGRFPRFEDHGIHVHPTLADAVYRALEPDPARRWQSAREFAEALGQAQRAAGEEWHGLQVAGLMVSLFPEDVESERQAEAHYGRIIQDIANAEDGQVESILAKAHVVTSPAADFATPTTQGRPRVVVRRDAAMVVTAGLMLAGGAGAYLAMTRPASPSTVAPPMATATLVLETDPPGATGRVAGRLLPAVTPAVVPDLPPGPVEVEVQQQGYAVARQVVTLSAGASETLRIRLTALPAPIVAADAPAPAPAAPAGNAPGPRRSAPSRSSQERRPPAQATSSAPAPAAAVNPEPAAAAAPAGQGTLDVNSTPWARIFIDGKDTGRFTPAAGIKVSAGSHVVMLVNDEENVRAQVNITVAAGETLNVHPALH